MLKPVDIDRARVRAHFATGRSQSFVAARMQTDLLDRLEPIVLDPVHRIVDVGCGGAEAATPLLARHPNARYVGIDWAPRGSTGISRSEGGHGLLRSARGLLGRLLDRDDHRETEHPPWSLQADAHRLPLASHRIDLLWCSATAHWFDDPLQVIEEWHRVLRPGGLVAIATLGPDSFRELASFGLSLPVFQDMHDWGDALVHAGFTQPVMESDRLVLEYSRDGAWVDDVEGLLDLDHACANDAQLRASLPRRALPRMSLELVYGHAWVPDQKRREDGAVPIRFDAGRRTRGQ